MTDLPVEPGEAPSEPTDRGPDPQVFGPEAHLPVERRLVVDGAGVIIEQAFGLQHRLLWASSRAVLVWPDRAEIVIDDETSLLLRASDWYHGDRAVAAIRAAAPADLLVVMPPGAEPQPVRYVLRGVATWPVAVLALLGVAAALTAGIAVGAVIQNGRWAALPLTVPFVLGTVAFARALYRRLRVPARWRDTAAVEGRSSTAVRSAVIRAPGPVLVVTECLAWVLAVTSVAVLVAVHSNAILVPEVLGIAGVVLASERLRRRDRADAARGPSGVDEVHDGADIDEEE